MQLPKPYTMEPVVGAPYGWKRMRYADRVAERRRSLDRAAELLVELCRQTEGIHAVYAFGSYGRGDIGSESDLDALIVRETDLPVGARQTDLRQGLASVTTGIDLVVVRPDEYTSLLPENSFGQTILRDARLLARFEANHSTITIVETDAT